MRAHTITTIIVLSALSIPAGAGADPVDSGYSRANAIAAGLEESRQSAGTSDYSSVNATAPPSSSPSGSTSADSGYSSLNAVSGAPADAPTLVSGPSGSGDGFQWGDAALGAGSALALVAFGGVALLTVRRRTAMSPSGSAS